ncbi:MAG: hypothetical protein WCT08_05295 [Patescibacteria group bacterium]|jgi:hypothetical protein
MLTNISYHLILGKPVIFWLGILTLLCLLLTASISYANRHNIRWIAFKWHKRWAIITIILAIIHGGLAFLTYF